MYFLVLTGGEPFIVFDLGAKYIRSAVCFDDKNLNIILNEHSERKTENIVSFDSDDDILNFSDYNTRRYVGLEAANIFRKNRSRVIHGFTHIIGKNFSNELDIFLKTRLYSFNMIGSSVNGIEIHVILSMVFSKYIDLAKQQFPGIKGIRTCFISVPSYFTSYQRRMVSQAAFLSGLFKNMILNDKECLAHSYAIDKGSTFLRSSKNILFCDIGHGKVSLVGYKFSNVVQTFQGSVPRPYPKFEELEYLWDDEVGGINFELDILEFISKNYGLSKSTSTLEDAEKILHALTLSDHVNITLSNEQYVTISRTDIEVLFNNSLTKINNLIKKVRYDYDSFELVGGASRIPSIKKLFTSQFGALTKLLNQEESILNGASYMGMIYLDLKMYVIYPSNLITYNISVKSNVSNASILFKSTDIEPKFRKYRVNSSCDFIVSLYYDSRVPIGADKLISKWIVEVESGNPLKYIITFDYQHENCSQVFISNITTLKSNISHINYRSIDDKHDSDYERNIHYFSILKYFYEKDQNLSKLQESKDRFLSSLFELKSNFTENILFQNILSKDDKEYVKRIIETYTNWFEKHNSSTTHSIFIKQRNKLLEDIDEYIVRVYEITFREKNIMILKELLDEIKVSVLVKWKKQNVKIPKKQRKALLSHVTQTNEWLERMIKEQEDLNPYDEPVLLSKDIEKRIKILNEIFNNLKESIKRNDIRENAVDTDGYGGDL